jgi:Coenzyme PQQ synthesis protein D (PqqD)
VTGDDTDEKSLAAIAGSFVPVPKGSVRQTEIEGEAALLDTATGSLHVLNNIGAAIWLALNGQRSTDEIVAELSAAAAADRGRVRADVEDFLRSLGQLGLLEAAPPEAERATPDG